MSDDWFTYMLAPDGEVEDGCHPEEAQAMKGYLLQCTTAHDAARAITRPVVTADNPREDIVRLWSFLMDALVELPLEYVGPLIALIRAIENLPRPNFEAVKKENRPDEILWKGLPGFANLWSDSYQSGSWREMAKATEAPERDELRAEHVRKAEVEARLVAEGLGDIPIGWGYEVVADALESSNALLDFDVPAATAWLVLCGQRFRQGAETGEETWALKPHITRLSTVPSRDLSRALSDQAMSLERWLLWEERLKELQTKPGVVWDAATTALEAMRVVNNVAL
jgi:hypothetical protein